jgi:hypothetical protein
MFYMLRGHGSSEPPEPCLGFCIGLTSPTGRSVGKRDILGDPGADWLVERNALSRPIVALNYFGQEERPQPHHDPFGGDAWWLLWATPQPDM